MFRPPHATRRGSPARFSLCFSESIPRQPPSCIRKLAGLLLRVRRLDMVPSTDEFHHALSDLAPVGAALRRDILARSRGRRPPGAVSEPFNPSRDKPAPARKIGPHSGGRGILGSATAPAGARALPSPHTDVRSGGAAASHWAGRNGRARSNARRSPALCACSPAPGRDRP